MYPFIRLAYQMFKARKYPPLGMGEVLETHHICWPWDLDMWMELNNGRALTLFDLGRLPLGKASGLIDALKDRGWGLTIAGSCPRYRRRVRMFDRVTIKSAAVGWDDKFMYLEHSMWRPDGECTSHMLARAAITSKKGIVPPAEVAALMGHTGPSPELSPWIKAWIESEKLRPWPPMETYRS